MENKEIQDQIDTINRQLNENMYRNLILMWIILLCYIHFRTLWVYSLLLFYEKLTFNLEENENES
jgi:hypothetical protein